MISLLHAKQEWKRVLWEGDRADEGLEDGACRAPLICKTSGPRKCLSHWCRGSCAGRRRALVPPRLCTGAHTEVAAPPREPQAQEGAWDGSLAVKAEGAGGRHLPS